MFKIFKTPEFKKAVNFYKDGIKENRKSFVISMGSAVVWCFLIVIQPYIIKRIIDDAIVLENRQMLIFLDLFGPWRKWPGMAPMGPGGFFFY